MNQLGKTYNSFETMQDLIFCNHPEWLIDYHKFKLSEKFMKKFNIALIGLFFLVLKSCRYLS